MNPVFLLPPSETKRPGGDGDPWDPGRGTFATLARERRSVAASLRKAMGDEVTAARLTGLSGQRGAAAVAANRRTLGAPTRPAWERYDGVVWGHLDRGHLPPAARSRAGRIIVVSALGGLFAADDPVPDYKLKMGASLPGIGPLARYWRGPATEALVEVAAGAPVWDLLPAEHRRSIGLDTLGTAVVTVEFRSPGGAGAAGHAAKAAKGRFVGHLLRSRGDLLDAAGSFVADGWTARVHGPNMVVVTAPAG
jgi:cytoplasmic iron level regulating protein YaaA (DUF328/UPF0246 family)